MLTTNVLQRVFRIRNGNNLGTAFTIDVDRRQYLVTTKHNVSTLANAGTIEIYHNNDWRSCAIAKVGDGPNNVDISVLAPTTQLSPDFPLPPDSVGLSLGQEVYFLGFPYHFYTDVGEMNGNYPLAFIKHAVVSGASKNGVKPRNWYLDGINNQGFSGGPVVWTARGVLDYKVFAVIAGYRESVEPVHDGDQTTQFTHRANTGIIEAYDIDNALDLIKANPIGAAI